MLLSSIENGKNIMDTGRSPHAGGGSWRSRNKLVLFGFLAIAAYFLWTEHRAHVVQFLPYVLLLLCPLFHLFHGGHGDHGGDDRDDYGGERK
jgi:hypothetical protein